VPFLKAKLKPIVAADAATVASLVRDLDSGNFKQREKASDALAKLGPAPGQRFVKPPRALKTWNPAAVSSSCWHACNRIIPRKLCASCELSKRLNTAARRQHAPCLSPWREDCPLRR
jgi:hypothetical protein